MTKLPRADRECWIWWAARTECLSALYRRARAGELTTAQLAAARGRLLRFDEAAAVVLPSEAIRSRADRLLATHPLRASDALQLAALLAAAEERPAGFPFVTLDDRQADAARKEGFSVVPD